MATVTDVEVANASFPTVRQDLNDILEAVATNFSADTEPTTTYANQWWYETDTDKLYIRNEANDAWIHVLTLDQTGNTVSEVQGAGGGDNIAEGNSSVEVIDTGTGYIQFNVDGAEIARIDSDGMKFGDNEKAIFGAGSDLQIYHNSSTGESYITESGTGNFFIQGTHLRLQDGSGNNYFSAQSGGESYLYHNGSQRAQFNSSGVAISGDMTLSSSGAVNSELRSDFAGLQLGTTSGHYLALRTNNSERMRIDTSGNVMVGKAVTGLSTVGAVIEAIGAGSFTTGSDTPFYVNRQTNDGTLIEFRQANAVEGSISVSGSTVSYNGGHLARWSRLADDSKDTTIVKGTVMSNLDEMVVWSHETTYWTEDDELPVDQDGNATAAVGDVKEEAYTEENEQLNKMVVSSIEGDANVAGVFVNWDDDDEFNDMNIAMTGDMVIRIAEGVTVERGDLLMSAGDGTAKPQDDDIVRSKTIAKVTSTHVSHTYDDGSYLVPCVLMAC